MKKRIIPILITILLIAGAAILLNKSHQKINAGKKNLISSDVVVSISEVGEMSTNTTLNLTGTLYPYTDLVVSAQAAGQITSVNAELGQHKTKGNVLATIDNKLKTLAVESSKVNLEKVKRDLDRYQSLFKGGAATQQQIDDAQIAYTNARIQLDQTRKQLSDATITAPISGIVTEKSAEAGSYINIGNPVVRIVDISRLRVKINVSESNIYKLSVGDQANILCDVFPEKTFTGKISFISSKGDEAHNYPVEIIVPNNGKLKAGTFANISIEIPGKGSSLSIPRSALLGSSSDAKVYVYKDGKVNMRKISVSGGNDQWLFVGSGLSKGEQVVTAGQINLIDGMAVKTVSNK
jgi:membrane fusion protein, multidrug efflux system